MTSHYPVKVRPLEDYKLYLYFDNNEERVFDVKPYLNDPFFSPLCDKILFNSVKTNLLTVEWKGEIDICPDELYYNSVLAK